MLPRPAFGLLCALHCTDRKTEPQGQGQGSLLSDSLEGEIWLVIYKSLEPLSLAVIFPIGELFSVKLMWEIPALKTLRWEDCCGFKDKSGISGKF